MVKDYATKDGRRGKAGQATRFRLLQAQILPSREAFNPVVYLARIHLVRFPTLLEEAAFRVKEVMVAMS